MPDLRPKPRVLIVDDERIIADTLALIMRSLGFESTAVYSGEAALEAAEQLLPDVLISDVIMGEMSGIEAAICISKTLPQCKIILFSGQAATSDLISQAGLDVYRFEVLTKPVHPEVLVDRVRSLAPIAPDRVTCRADYDSAIGY
jgi:CheY-like chemotaxis protein